MIPDKEVSMPNRTLPKVRKSIVIIRIIVSILLLIGIFKSVGISRIMNSFLKVSPFFIILLCLGQISDRILMGFKWNLLLKANGIIVPAWEAIRLYFCANLVGYYSPGGIGGDIYRLMALSRLQKNNVVFSTVILERFIGFSAISIYAMLGLPFILGYLWSISVTAAWIMIAIVISPLFLLLISLKSRIPRQISRRFPFFRNTLFGKKISELYAAYIQHTHYKRTIFIFVILTFLEVFLTILVDYLGARALHVNVSFIYLLHVSPLLQILIRMPISFAGLGVQEGLYAFFLSKAGFTVSDGLALSLLLRLTGSIVLHVPAVIMLIAAPLRFQMLSQRKICLRIKN